MVTSPARVHKQYQTWDSFKKELELELWCHVPNDVWLKIKPKHALPWNDQDLVQAILKIAGPP